MAAVSYARDVGCETIQIFAKSPLMWASPPRDRCEVARFRAALEEADITIAATHAAYLINVASADDALWKRSVAALAAEIEAAHELGAPAVVLHLGSTPAGPAAAQERVAAALEAALRAACFPTVSLLLENAAGAGHTFGWRTEDIAAVYAAVPASMRARLGACIDTCHAHAAGYDLTSESGWSAVLGPLADTGMPIRLVHANDALGDRSSHRDRHAWIGEGAIGTEGFAWLFSQPQLEHADVVVEMPGEPPRKDAVNVARLKALRSAQARAPQPPG